MKIRSIIMTLMLGLLVHYGYSQGHSIQLQIVLLNEDAGGLDVQFQVKTEETATSGGTMMGGAFNLRFGLSTTLETPTLITAGIPGTTLSNPQPGLYSLDNSNAAFAPYALPIGTWVVVADVRILKTAVPGDFEVSYVQAMTVATEFVAFFNYPPFTISEFTDLTVSGSLPIELLSFEAKRTGEYKSRLEWATLSEVNNEYFELEHSLDGVEFRKIAEIDGAGHSQVQIDYAYVHEEPAPGLNYYRLKQVDYDGVYSYSDIRTVYFEPTYEVEVYPNPFMEELRIQHKYPHEVSIELLDSQSRVLRREKEIGSHHRMQMSEYPAGIYYLRVIDSEQVKLLQLVKN